MDDRNLHYKEAVDRIHAPQELVERTLQRVHAENRAAQPARKVIPLFAGRRTAPMLAAAACLVLLLGAGLFWALSPAQELPFGTLDVAQLPELPMAVRGDSDFTVEDFTAQTGVDPASLLPGYVLEAAHAQQGASAQGQLLSLLEASYAGDAQLLTLQLSDFETVLYGAMAQLEPVQLGGTAVRFARDAASGALYAAWSDGDLCWVVQQDGSDTDAFVQTVRGMLNP